MADREVDTPSPLLDAWQWLRVRRDDNSAVPTTRGAVPPPVAARNRVVSPAARSLFRDATRARTIARSLRVCLSLLSRIYSYGGAHALRRVRVFPGLSPNHAHLVGEIATGAALGTAVFGFSLATFVVFVPNVILRRLPIRAELKPPPFDAREYPPLFNLSRPPNSVARFWSQQWHRYARPQSPSSFPS